ncbi:uncharacterized protein [Onthophagus taurus]|uniref:uncharacterized protein n=1 Tax=Onthophagus taurus TaxID=166361 RepID=UPI000C20353B|nr:uncharacterized protein LOC111425781 [Onthophagus taurus]XP_022915792.1 uncharacterized protein LOC111425781 [Onthophagus taurus]
MVMEIMENITAPEPHWILDQAESGSMYWRRDPAENKARVRFRYDVEIREFYRNDHELEEIEWPEKQLTPAHNTLTTMSMTLFCIAVTVLLPWYIMGVN